MSFFTISDISNCYWHGDRDGGYDSLDCDTPGSPWHHFLPASGLPTSRGSHSHCGLGEWCPPILLSGAGVTRCCCLLLFTSSHRPSEALSLFMELVPQKEV